MAALAEKEELIDGLTFDEWLDMVPVDVYKMTKVERDAARLEVQARAAAIREKRADAGKGYYTIPSAGYDDCMMAEPSPPSYYTPTGTAEQDAILAEGVAYQRAGGRLLTKEEVFAGLRAAIDSVKYA